MRLDPSGPSNPVQHFVQQKQVGRLDETPTGQAKSRGGRLAKIPGSFLAKENAQSMTPRTVQFRKVLRAHIVGQGCE